MRKVYEKELTAVSRFAIISDRQTDRQTDRQAIIRLIQYVFGYCTITLGEIATIKTGSKPAELFESKTTYEYINAGTTNSGYTKVSNCEGDTVYYNEQRQTYYRRSRI